MKMKKVYLVALMGDPPPTPTLLKLGLHPHRESEWKRAVMAEDARPVD